VGVEGEKERKGYRYIKRKNRKTKKEDGQREG